MRPFSACLRNELSAGIARPPNLGLYEMRNLLYNSLYYKMGGVDVNCLKCGREITEEEVFCEYCLQDAEEFPVDPNTAIYLPRREKTEAPKKPVRKRTVPLDEQVKALRKRARTLTILLLLCGAMLIAAVYPTLAYLTEERYRPGQNYTPMVTIPPSPTVSTTETTP